MASLKTPPKYTNPFPGSHPSPKDIKKYGEWATYRRAILPGIIAEMFQTLDLTGVTRKNVSDLMMTYTKNPRRHVLLLNSRVVCSIRSAPNYITRIYAMDGLCLGIQFWVLMHSRVKGKRK